MKKFISILISFILIFASFSVTGSAAESDSDIVLGQTLRLSLTEFGELFLRFVPEKSGYYALVSSNYDSCDPAAFLYDGEKSTFLKLDDDFYGVDFCLKYEFEAGETYYFKLSSYDGDGTADITLRCAHSFDTDGFCTLCGEECSHMPVYLFYGNCECNGHFSGVDIKPGDTYVCVPEKNDYFGKILRFIPEKSGRYLFASADFSYGHSNPYIDVYTEDEEYIGGGYNEESPHFKLTCELEAGKVYYALLGDFNTRDTSGFRVHLNVADHETKFGETHELAYAPGKDPSCTTNGFTDGLYCEECNEYVFGHEEVETVPHVDINADGACDECNIDIMISACNHICHTENPFFSVIWRIVNFFNRILGIKAICECGEYHY